MLLLVRHCTSTGPDPEAPLAEAGYREAEQLADQLAREPVDRIVSSPYRRALETIAPLAERRGLTVQTDPRLAERWLSAEPRADWREFVQRAFEDPEARAPGGESARETLVRGWAAIQELLRAGERTIVVSHGQLLSLVLHRIDPGFGYAGWESLRNPDVFRLTGAAGRGLRFERWAPAP